MTSFFEKLILVYYLFQEVEDRLAGPRKRCEENNEVDSLKVVSVLSSIFNLPWHPIFHGCKIVHWDPWNAKRRCPKKNGMGYVKMLGFQQPIADLRRGGLPIKVPISQLLLILGY